MAGRGTARIVVVDDHALMRAALTAFVASDPSLEVVAECENGVEAIDTCRRLRPDVVLMDLHMPVLDGVSATRRITSDCPGVKVIAVTTFASAETVVPALRAGATAYLLKDCRPEELVDAVHKVLDDQAVLSPALGNALVEAIRGDEAPVSRPDLGGDHALTDREFAVLERIAQGIGNAAIARDLGISEAAVKSRLTQIMSKLDVGTRVQVLVRATELGLVTPRLRRDP